MIFACALCVLALGCWLSLFSTTWPATDLDWQILQQLRWPRLIAVLFVGSALSICGLILQALLRNPLSEPYILGLSGGASVAVLAGGVLGLSGVWRSPLAFIGALSSLLLLFALTRAGRADPIRILLTGVLISAGAGALGSLLITLSDPLNTQVSLVWLMGDFSGSAQPLWTLILWCLIVAALARLGRVLDLLTRGAETAQTLGLNLPGWRMGLLGLVSLVTALAVSVAGPIGFVGLVVPHAVRLMLPHGGHRLWLSASGICGAGLLVWADWLGRVVMDPIQLPAGVIMALIGIPSLLVLLGRTYAVR